MTIGGQNKVINSILLLRSQFHSLLSSQQSRDLSQGEGMILVLRGGGLIRLWVITLLIFICHLSIVNVVPGRGAVSHEEDRACQALQTEQPYLC